MAGMYGCFKSEKSDNAAMASGSPDGMPSQEPAEVAEECQGKKRSKFQTFKKFFTRKKRKDQSAAGAEAGLKASQSSDNVSKTSENNTLTRSEGDKGSGSKMNLGGKAKSHDSVFVSDPSDANEALGASQDSIHGKVKSLQLQLKQAIRLGSPPSLMCVKRTEDAGTMSEDDGLPSSPPEYTSMNKAQRGSSNSLEGEDSDDDQLSCAASSRAVSPLVVPGDFSQPASPFGCLDNSAAKHKLGLRYKACNKRKPLSRIDLKAKVDSLVEKGLDTSVTDVLEEKEQHKTTEIVGADDLLTPSLEREENGEEEMEGDEEEQEQPQHSREPLLTNKEEREEEEDEFEGDPDVPQRSDPLSLPQLCHSEEDVPDAQPSSKPSSRASTPDSPSTSPEPIDCPKEYLLDPPGVAYGEDTNRMESDLGEESGEEENEVQETREEESSFLQEVLSSLKTPLVSSSLGIETETVVQEIKEEVKEKKRDDEALEEEEKEEEEEEDRVEETVDEPAIYQAASIDSPQKTGEEEVRIEETVDEPAIYQAAPADSPQKTGEEEEMASLCMSQGVGEEEEAVKECEEERSHEKEEPAVEQLGEHCQKEEEDKETEEVQTEDQNFTGNDVSQVEEEETGVESEGEEEVMELQKEAEAEEEEVQERREEDDAQLEEAHERVEELEEAIEEERDGAKEMTEVLPDAAAEEVQDALTVQEVDEGAGVVAGDEHVSNMQHDDDDDENPSEMDDQVSASVPESQEIARQSYGEEIKGGGEEEVENVIEPDLMEQKLDQEEDKEAKQSDGDQTEDHEEQEGVETSRSDMTQDERDHTETTKNAFPRPSSLSFPESNLESQIQESGTITPSKTSTTTLHINLLSPSSDKSTSFFQQSPTATHPKQSEIPSQQALAVTDQDTGSTEEEPAEIIETAEQEQSALEEVATPPICVEEIVNQPSTCPDQSKVRFTIAPAWQRSISLEDGNESLTPPSSPPTGVSSSSSTCMGPRGEDATSTTKEYPELKAEPASPSKVELVLSSGRGRNAGSTVAKPQSNATSPPSHESGVMVEGNPDSLFGVRLRKTSVLRRFSVEEEIPEPPSKPQVHPTSSKTDSPQPISGSPFVNPPSSNKPVLPKKPETLYGEASGRTKRMSEAAAASGVSGRSDSPSWISVAKQKQKIYKENSLEEVPVNKEEQERKSSLPTYVGSAVSREPSIKTGSLLGISKPAVSVEKETRRSLSSPATAPSQLPKSQVVPSTVAPKPQVPPATSKHPLQTNPPQRCLSPPTPVLLAQKSPPCTSPPSLSKCSTSPMTPEPQSTTATSSPAPISSRTTLEKTSTRAPGVSSQTPSSQRGQSPQALAQDEPPWMALAKKKAKAWSEMPQIVQ